MPFTLLRGASQGVLGSRQGIRRRRAPQKVPRLAPLEIVAEVASKAMIICSKRKFHDRGQVSRWILRFVFCSLSQYALPSDAVASSCFCVDSEDLGGAAIAN